MFREPLANSRMGRRKRMGGEFAYSLQSVHSLMVEPAENKPFLIRDGREGIL
jgi:hypothetical protein